jgi:hypothetical protein
VTPSLIGPPFLQSAPGFRAAPELRYPAIDDPNGPTYDVGAYRNLAGVIGLDPNGPVSHGMMCFRWTSDAAGERQTGVQGFPLTSLIPSMAQLNLPNLGRYCYVDYTPQVGPNALAVSLFGTQIDRTLPGDTFLIEDMAQEVVTTKTIYPADYCAGEVGVFFEASTALARATIYGVNLTDDSRRLDVLPPGRWRTITPMGTWFVVVWNPTPAPITYTLAMTPLLT